jgi:hypothetical protein
LSGKRTRRIAQLWTSDRRQDCRGGQRSGSGATLTCPPRSAYSETVDKPVASLVNSSAPLGSQLWEKGLKGRTGTTGVALGTPVGGAPDCGWGCGGGAPVGVGMPPALLVRLMTVGGGLLGALTPPIAAAHGTSQYTRSHKATGCTELECKQLQEEDVPGLPMAICGGSPRLSRVGEAIPPPPGLTGLRLAEGTPPPASDAPGTNGPG